MTEPTPQPPKQSSFFSQFYANNEKTIDWAFRLLLIALVSWTLAKLHYNGQTGEFTKDLVTRNEQTQKAVAQGTKELAANELGKEAPVVKVLESATTQPAPPQTK